MALWRKWLEESQPLRIAAHRYVGRKLREITEPANTPCGRRHRLRLTLGDRPIRRGITVDSRWTKGDAAAPARGVAAFGLQKRSMPSA